MQSYDPFATGGAVASENDIGSQAGAAGATASPGPSPGRRGADNELSLEVDTDHAVEIAKDVFWVGFYDEHEKLHCNPYLIRNGEESIFIDPGSVPDFPVVARKAFALVSANSISTIILHHQDPDLCASAPIFEDLKEDYDIDFVSHRVTSYFLHHYGIKGNLVRLDEFGKSYFTRGGRELRFYWTPYAHSFGAIMTLDVKSNTLFTSDILGGLGEEWELYHSDEAMGNMISFMQTIMPSNRILRYALTVIERIGADLIAPQHGQVIRPEQFPAIKNALWELPCGMDRVEDDVTRELGWRPTF